MANLALQWASEVCAEAEKASIAGDLSLVNGLARHSAMQYYFNNVHMLRTVTRESFAMYYPGMVKEIERLHQEYLRDSKITEAAVKIDETDTRLSGVEAALQRLEETVKALATAISPKPDPEPEPESEPDEEEIEDDTEAVGETIKSLRRKRGKG